LLNEPNPTLTLLVRRTATRSRRATWRTVNSSLRRKRSLSTYKTKHSN